MERAIERGLFGLASNCETLTEVLSLLKALTCEEAQMAAVAYGMLLSANSTPGGRYREDALEVLTALGSAKAKLDSAMCHTRPTIDVTCEILFDAQVYADSVTIPCTEWPTSKEIVDRVSKTASKYGTKNREWMSGNISVPIAGHEG